MFLTLDALKSAAEGSKAGFWFNEIDVEVHGRKIRGFKTTEAACYIIVSESIPKKTRENFFVVKFVVENGTLRSGRMTQDLNTFVEAIVAMDNLVI